MVIRYLKIKCITKNSSVAIAVINQSTIRGLRQLA
jgi:hypothetical protein